MTEIDEQIQSDYKNRINRVFEFIDQNLESDLSLNTISEIAFFSPFHFHRIFKFVTGETLNDYVKRRKIEKSALDILHKNLSIIEVSHKYGFSDNSSFSKTFKKYYGISPTRFKKENSNKHVKIRPLKSKNGQDYPDNEKYICIINNLKSWIKMNAKIKIKELPKIELAYVSCMGSQNLENAYHKLMGWAIPKGLMNDQTKMITIYHDSFKVTPAEKVRMSASIMLKNSTETTGEVGFRSIQSGKFIVSRFEIGLNEFEKSWTGLFLWMNENGYTKADRDPFEIYYNNLNEHPERKAIVEFCIPIE